jgi:hypothetical protein
MQKHKFSISCPDALFMETAAGPLEHQKLTVDISRSGPTEKHYVTRRSHRMQKHMLGVMGPGVLFMKTASDPPEQEK